MSTLFGHALAAATQYPGSHKIRARYSYGGETLASFIELTPRFLHGLHKDDVIQKFRRALQAVPGVSRVIDHPRGSKTQQGNQGDHYQETNFYVYTEYTPNRGMEFELTRNDHAKYRRVDFTVSAAFKPPPLDLASEAWRILRAACYGSELLPSAVDNEEKRLLSQWKKEVHEEEWPTEEEGPSSASPQVVVSPEEQHKRARADADDERTFDVKRWKGTRYRRPARSRSRSRSLDLRVRAAYSESLWPREELDKCADLANLRYRELSRAVLGAHDAFSMVAEVEAMLPSPLRGLVQRALGKMTLPPGEGVRNAITQMECIKEVLESAKAAWAGYQGAALTSTPARAVQDASAPGKVDTPCPMQAGTPSTAAPGSASASCLAQPTSVVAEMTQQMQGPRSSCGRNDPAGWQK